jgi:hypothetical protein
MVRHRGGCHCGRIRFEVEAPEKLTVRECNCSICAMTGFLHLLVAKPQFTLLAGREDLLRYTFNTGVAEHLFCRVCGIKSFYVPRSHPDGYSVNTRCLDAGALADAPLRDFDGQNWEHNAGDFD